MKRSLVSLAAMAAMARPAPCPVAECAKNEPPAGGCSHVDCPHRRQLTAAPLRASDGLVPARNANTTHSY